MKLVLMAVGALAGLCSQGENAWVAESARQIPVCQDVDVVVVGGSCGAVAAAQAAAQAGAKVFLAAPRPYLGDDVAGCLRLWLEPGETPDTPLARALFVQTNSALPFTYKASLAASPRHDDVRGTGLCDGLYQQAASHSVEYSNDVSIVLTLDRPSETEGVELLAFSRSRDFAVGGATVSTSLDRKSWSAP